jgi:hypothetical protein
LPKFNAEASALFGAGGIEELSCYAKNVRADLTADEYVRSRLI